MSKFKSSSANLLLVSIQEHFSACTIIVHLCNNFCYLRNKCNSHPKMLYWFKMVAHPGKAGVQLV